MSALPRLHHNQSLLVQDEPGRIAATLAPRAADLGLARDELKRLVGRHQRRIRQLMQIAPNIDMVLIDETHLAVEDDELPRVIGTEIGEQRLACLRAD